MKRFTCAVFALTSVLAGIQPLPAQVQGQWTGTGAMQSTRELDAQVRLISGRVLAMGGVDNSNTILSSAEVYNPGPGTWTLTGSMSAARNLFPAVVLTSGKVLVAGGLGTGGAVLAGAELYNPTTGIWSSAGELSVARFGHTATLLQNGKVLVAGGCTTNNCNADTAVSELYDPTSNSWSKTGSLNTARYYHAAVRLNSGKVLVIAGSTGGATNSCELYDPSEGTWSNAASTTTARFYHAATLLADGKVLVTGGAISRYPLNSAELYNPSTNAWALTGSMTTGRYAHTATLLTDNTVLVAGGEGQSISCGKACTSYIPTAKADIYNEAAGKFTATSSLSRARAYHSATLLGTGRVLVDGGVGYNALLLYSLGLRRVLYRADLDVFCFHPDLRRFLDRTHQPFPDGHRDQRQQSLGHLQQHNHQWRLLPEQHLPRHAELRPELHDHGRLQTDRGGNPHRKRDPQGQLPGQPHANHRADRHRRSQRPDPVS